MLLIVRHRMELLVCMVCLAMLGYFCWQGFYGIRSIHYREKLSSQVATVAADLNSVTHQRKALEARVQMVRPGSVDADLIDEIVRRDLNMGNNSEVVVILN